MKTLAEAIDNVKDKYIQCLENEVEIPAKLQAQYAAVKVLKNARNESFFDYLRAVSTLKYGSYPEEKERIVRETVAELLPHSADEKQPALLLGKIQSGKTDTFESIIGLSFDNDVQISVVITKGVNTLAEQTISRLRQDLKFMVSADKVTIFDILLGDTSNLQYDAEHKKIIIVCKKEATNLEALKTLFKKNEFLRSKKVLLVDDEADFASRNYKSVKGETDLQEISKKIEQFGNLCADYHYLQVTATPYSLFLHPDGMIKPCRWTISLPSNLALPNLYLFTLDM